MTKQLERQYLTAIVITGGIITLVEPDGNIGYYRQRGMGRLSQIEIANLIKRGIINPNCIKLKELPKHYSISFEDEGVMGRATATFKAS